MMIGKNVYVEKTIQNIPRILGLLDRNESSKTYGCFDRQFWHYKVVDFPCARMQEALLTLALIYSRKYTNNKYFHNKKILDLVSTAIKFWSDIQNKNGSFNEWYPNENSFVATAFSTYAVSESLLLLGKRFEENTQQNIEEALVKSGDWLTKNDELKVSNQEAGAILTLYNLYLLTRKKTFLKSSREKTEKLLKNQSKEGWFPEYGGPDIGYLSLLVDYLSKTFMKTKDVQLLNGLKKSTEFITYFIHPDFTFGGEYASRNTEYLIPSGFEILVKTDNASVRIANAVMKSLALHDFNLDDRYLCYNGYTYLQAYDNFAERNVTINLPFRKNFKKSFGESLLEIFSTPRYYAISNLKKGGVIKIFSKKQPKVFVDCGITGSLANGEKITTQWLDENYRYQFYENSLYVEGSFHKLQFILPSPLKTIISRSFQSTIGKSQKISPIVRNILREKIITKSPTVPVLFRRKIEFESTDVKIQDLIDVFDKKINFEDLSIGGKFSFLFIPSSRYFSPQDLQDSTMHLTKKEIQKLNNDRKISVSRKIDF